MSEIKIKIEGLDSLKTALQRAPAKTIDEVGKAMQKSAIVIQSQAIKEAPVNKGHGGGNLRQNIRIQTKTKTRVAVVSQAPYSLFVERGTSPHIIEVRNKKVLANKRTGAVFGRRVKHPGTKANPYMKRAVDKSKGKVHEFFQTAIHNIIKSMK